MKKIESVEDCLKAIKKYNKTRPIGEGWVHKTLYSYNTPAAIEYLEYYKENGFPFRYKDKDGLPLYRWPEVEFTTLYKRNKRKVLKLAAEWEFHHKTWKLDELERFLNCP